MQTTVWIPGDQLNPRISSLDDLSPSECVVWMVESVARGNRLLYHKQKLALVWSAMRHFAEELRGLGYSVDYYPTHPNLRSALAKHIRKHRPSCIRLMATAEYAREERLAKLISDAGIDVEITPSNMFLSDRGEFARYTHGKKALRMEAFYRQMRRKTRLLMDGRKPEGGQWNYDRLNRDRPPAEQVFPPVPRIEPDEITRAVIDFVARHFPGHFGELDGFGLPVRRGDAEVFFQDFLRHRLDLFGPYEDAVVAGQRALYHSLISPLLNIGLLEPLDVCRQAEACYYNGTARLNSVEGFIRQVIGWREFVYQVYHRQMPDYLRSNYFAADLPLPDFYWTADTDMFCIADAVKTLRRYGINHHIQRLMITGNFALIAGIKPQVVNDWYWLAYADAYEWVVSPNVLGLSLYADGGVIATKPYAASANYINKMSDCCQHCTYKPRQTLGDSGCPFNALYWDFLARNREILKGNPRMSLMLAQLDRRDPEELKAVRARAAQIQQRLQRRQRV